MSLPKFPNFGNENYQKRLEHLRRYLPLRPTRGLPTVAVAPLSMRSYQKLVPDSLYEEIIKLANDLKGVHIIMLNATAYGGGVSEIFKSMVPLMNSLGVKVDWLILPPNDRFFNVTKTIHNGLQGADISLSARMQKTYLDYNRRVAKLLAHQNADVYEIHDPQPAAVASFTKLKHTIWRCHIDTSTPNEAIWEFLKPYIEKHDELIFTMPQFTPHDLEHHSLNYFTPTIDPLSIKNVLLSRDFAAAMMQALGIDTRRPLITQVSRFDPWKDPIGVIDAFRLVKKQFPKAQLALVGSMASDDPEGAEIFRRVERYQRRDKDIHIFTNLTGVGEIEVNAFQTYSDIVIQKSLREGFGLTVTEAMWKSRPVVGGKVGGITLQIEDEHTGLLVDSVEDCAAAMIRLLKDKRLAGKLAANAHKKVQREFLHPRLIRDHLRLYKKLLG